jgi:hypothetical protein
MKSLLMLLIAFSTTQFTFGQKAKAFEAKANVQSVIVTGGSNTSLSPKQQMKAEITNIRNHSSVVLGNYSSDCPKCKEQPAISRTGGKQAVKIYTCEMHPDVACNRNGDCPICHRG